MNTAYAALRKIVYYGIALTLIAMPIAMLVGYLLNGQAGLLGAGIGFGLAAMFIGITSVVALLTRSLSVQSLGFAVLGSWLLKVVLLIAALAWLRGEDFYHRPSLLISMLLGLVGYLTIEALITLKSKTVYLETD